MTLAQGSVGWTTIIQPNFMKLYNQTPSSAIGMQWDGSKLSVFYNSGGGSKQTVITPGDIITNGKITTTELVVTQTPVFPDYVFGKDYKLTSLKETKRYIEKNGKLPGMVSAADVKKNGLSVGVIQTQLLEKIEEMTLHMIRMQEKMEKMQKHIDELENK
jgi:hypothetical protein